MRRVLLSVAMAAATVLSAFGESTDCTNPSLVVPDGRISQSQFAAGATNYYAFYGQTGHSYSVEFVPADNLAGNTVLHFTGFKVYGPNDALQACRGNSSLQVTFNSSIAPTISRNSYGNGMRGSFVQPDGGQNPPPDIIAITNTGGPGAYTYRIVDTTLFAPRWSTYAGYDTQWGFMNLSDMTVQGTLTVYDINNQQLNSIRVTIPPAGLVVRTSSFNDLDLPRNTTGSAIFTHNAPPRSILADAYMLNSSATLVVYAKFESRPQ